MQNKYSRMCERQEGKGLPSAANRSISVYDKPCWPMYMSGLDVAPSTDTKSREIAKVRNTR